MDFNQQRSLVADHGTPEASSAQPPPSPPQKPADVPFRPSIAVIVVVLTTMFSLTFLLLLYAKHCRRQAAATASAAAAATGGGGVAALSGTAEDRTSGVERAVVESLPLFRFASLMGEKDGIECAVCLSRFEAEALLRLLPKCRHAFHIDCVDAWLDSHSTCPLCRSRVHPEDVLLLLRPDPPPPPPLVTAAPPSRRISGRHSSAGEKASGCAIAVLVERQRKDGQLLPEVEEVGGRYSHRVVFSGGGSRERWSDLRPSDLIFLRSDTTITGSGRFSPAAVGGGTFRIGPRNVPEMTSANRVSRTGGSEERTMRRWVRFAGKRTAGWLGGDDNG